MTGFKLSPTILPPGRAVVIDQLADPYLREPAG
jgi:hypothetical protein